MNSPGRLRIVDCGLRIEKTTARFIKSASRIKSAICNPQSAIVCICLLTFAAISARAQEQPAEAVKANPASSNTGTITGRVVSDDGRPLPDAVIYFYRAYASTPGGLQSVSTDSDGKFQTTALPDGLYTVSATLPGFVIAPDATTDTGETKYYRPGDSVSLTLIKGGVITGTVRDANGEPVVAIPIRATRVRDAMGRPLTTAFGYAQPRWTDDRGIYRLYGLQPGVYVVSAGGSLGVGLSIFNAYDNDTPTYFPSSTRDTAVEITVRGNDEESSTDIRYRGEHGHTISGVINGSIDPNSRFGISITLTQASIGASAVMTYVQPGTAKPSFSFSGVADGEYELVAQQTVIASGESAASTPRRVTVKATDVTGLEISLTPLASIAGHVFLEAAPKESCADKSGAKLIETLISARRDEKAQTQDEKSQSKETPRSIFFSASGGIPNDQGEFTIRNLLGGAYRMTTRLPSDAWYVRSIALPGAPAARPSNSTSKPAQPKSATTLPVLTLKTGERATGLNIQIAQDAANLRGRVVAATEGASLPANLKVYLVPQERERAEDVLRYGEATINSDGTFTLQNLAPGHYFIIARPVPESDLSERTPRPLLWDADTRAKLRREAEAAKTTIELQPCQRATGYSLRYAPTQVTTNP